MLALRDGQPVGGEMIIEVTRETSPTNRMWWCFSTAGDFAVRLYRFEYQTRATARHKWRLAPNWPSAWDSMDNRGYDGSGIQPTNVPLPDDVNEEALSKARALVHIVPHYREAR